MKPLGKTMHPKRKMLVPTSFFTLFAEIALMPTLLHIDSSPRAASVSSQLAATFVERWKKHNPSGVVFQHNTAFEQIPYLDEAAINACFAPAEALTAEQKQKLTISDKLTDELVAADLLVLGVPMWNLGIPASLKAWIDQIVRPGRTFAYTSAGVAPLLVGKKAYIFSSRGGAYPVGTPYHAYDQQEPYLRTVLGFLGITDINFVYVENQSRSGDAPAQGLAAAQAALAALTI